MVTIFVVKKVDATDPGILVLSGDGELYTSLSFAVNGGLEW